LDRSILENYPLPLWHKINLKLNANNLVGAEKDFELSLKIVPNRLSTVINLSIVLIKLNKLKNLKLNFN
jgi:hypothetical protein